jgi:hypothetical protein
MKKNDNKPERPNAPQPANVSGEFPSPRYFQVHFEHLENLLNEARQCMEALKKQLAEMDAQAVAGRAGETHSIRRSVAADAHYSLRCDPPNRKPPRKKLPSEVSTNLRPAPPPELGTPGDSSNC